MRPDRVWRVKFEEPTASRRTKCLSREKASPPWRRLASLGGDLGDQCGSEFRSGDRIVVRYNWDTHPDLDRCRRVSSAGRRRRRFRRDIDLDVIHLSKA